MFYLFHYINVPLIQLFFSATIKQPRRQLFATGVAKEGPDIFGGVPNRLTRETQKITYYIIATVKRTVLI